MSVVTAVLRFVNVRHRELDLKSTGARRAQLSGFGHRCKKTFGFFQLRGAGAHKAQAVMNTTKANTASETRLCGTTVPPIPRRSLLGVLCAVSTAHTRQRLGRSHQ